MARRLRIEFPGAVYHVTARGNARQDIFLDDDDRALFLGVLEQVVSEILAGKPDLNTRRIRALAKRFGVSPAVFV
jgi:antitoxin component HigA of HigAB toxin-antitoxin module